MPKNTDNHRNFDAEMFRQPLESLTGLPNMAYISSAFAEFERDQVLSKTWF